MKQMFELSNLWMARRHLLTKTKEVRLVHGTWRRCHKNTASLDDTQLFKHTR